MTAVRQKKSVPDSWYVWLFDNSDGEDIRLVVEGGEDEEDAAEEALAAFYPQHRDYLEVVSVRKV